MVKINTEKFLFTIKEKDKAQVQYGINEYETTIQIANALAKTGLYKTGDGILYFNDSKNNWDMPINNIALITEVMKYIKLIDTDNKEMKVTTSMTNIWLASYDFHKIINNSKAKKILTTRY